MPHTAASSPGPWSRTLSPPTSQLAAASPPWKCGTRPQSGTQQGRLAGPRHAGQHGEASPPRSRARRRAAPARRAPGSGRRSLARARSAQARATPSRAPRPANGSDARRQHARDQRAPRRPRRHLEPRVELDRADAGGAARDGRHREQRRGEATACRGATTAAALRAGPPAARVAAHLERGRHVDRAVERARQRRPRHREPAGRLRAAARRVAHPQRVAGEHRHEPRGERGGERRAVGDAPEQPQQLVGIDARPRRARRPARTPPRAGRPAPPATSASSVMSKRLPEELAAADQQRVPLLVDERVDERHSSASGSASAAARAQLARPRRRRRPRSDHPAEHRAEHQGCS